MEASHARIATVLLLTGLVTPLIFVRLNAPCAYAQTTPCNCITDAGFRGIQIGDYCLDCELGRSLVKRGQMQSR